MKKQGILIVISGFSGSGKSTIVKELTSRYQQYALSVSATTRSPRPGEKEGREYFFKSVKEFEQMIADGDFIEYARYVHNYYGTPKAYVEEQLALGRDVILEIEIQGTRKIKKLFPDAVLLFVTTKDARTLKERLSNRGTETEEIIRQRLERAAKESEGIEEYDYLLVNDVLEDSIEQVHSIVENEHRKAKRNLEFIYQIKEEVNNFLEVD